MKKLKHFGLTTAGILIYIGLFLIYVIDRILTSFLFWIEIQPIELWMPKTTKLNEVKAQFPKLTTEACEGIIETRLKSREYVKNSLFRLGLFASIGLIIFVLMWIF